MWSVELEAEISKKNSFSTNGLRDRAHNINNRKHEEASNSKEVIRKHVTEQMVRWDLSISQRAVDSMGMVSVATLKVDSSAAIDSIVKRGPQYVEEIVRSNVKSRPKTTRKQLQIPHQRNIMMKRRQRQVLNDDRNCCHP